MKMPERLLPLAQVHMIDDVLGQLQSGKEAEVFIVFSEGELRCAKVYKGANDRTFKQRVQYTEGRKVRSGRRSRAMESNSRYGRGEREKEWQNAEVDALALLGAAGVMVPKTYGFYEGVLLLEMIVDVDGSPAPRLNDVKLTPEKAREYYQTLVRQAVLMLCAGLVHGDYSEFNVLVSGRGLVIIDFPQVVQATANNAFEIFERDLKQLAAFFGKVAPELMKTDYPKEIWKLYKNAKLKPDSPLTGRVEVSHSKVDLGEVLHAIDDARDDEMQRRKFKKS